MNCLHFFIYNICGFIKVWTVTLYITTTTPTRPTKLSSSRQHHCKISLIYVNWLKNPLQKQKSCRYFLQTPSYSPFCFKFSCHGNWGRWAKMATLHSVAHQRIHSYRRKNLAYISYTDRVIAFFPKFRCHGNGGRSGKMRLIAFNGPSPKTPYTRKNLSDIFYTRQVIANFVPNFVAMATGVGREKCGWHHSMAHPRKPPIDAKISQMFLT